MRSRRAARGASALPMGSSGSCRSVTRAPWLLLTQSVVLSNNKRQAARKVKVHHNGRHGATTQRSSLTKLLAKPSTLQRGPRPAHGRTAMTDRSHRKPAGAHTGLSRRTFTAGLGGLGAAGMLAGTGPFSIGRAQGAPLKVGVLLPRSGVQAGIGQDCQRGVEIAAGILKDLKLPELAIMNGDTESNVEVSALPRRAADQRGRAAARRRLRLRPDHGDRAGGRAEGHSARHQHCRGPAHHRAGLQVRVPQFPDRADDPGRRLRQPEGDLRGRRLGAEDGGVHARERYLRHGHAEGHRRRHAQVQHALQDRSRRSPTIRPRATCRSRWRRPRRPAPRRC